MPIVRMVFAVPDEAIVIGLDRPSEDCLIENSHRANAWEVGPKEKDALGVGRVNFSAKPPARRLIRFERKAREVDEPALYPMYKRRAFRY